MQEISSTPASKPQLVTSNNPAPVELGPSIDPKDVDRLAELKRLKDAHKPVEKEYEVLSRKFQEAYDKLPADKEYTAEGNLYRLQVGMKKNERTITNKSKLKRFLVAMKLFDEAWSIALAFIDKHLSAEQRNQVLTEDRTGNRELKPVLKEPAQAAALPKAA